MRIKVGQLKKIITEMVQTNDQDLNLLRQRAMASIEDNQSQTDDPVTKRMCFDVVKYHAEMMSLVLPVKQLKSIAVDLYSDLTGHQSDGLGD